MQADYSHVLPCRSGTLMQADYSHVIPCRSGTLIIFLIARHDFINLVYYLYMLAVPMIIFSFYIL